MNASTFRRLALALPDTTEALHFDRAAFRTPQRIFATLANDGTANLKLSPREQNIAVERHPDGAQSVSGGWGRQGWTTLVLAQLTAAQVESLLAEAHAHAAKKPSKTKATAKRATKRG